MRTSRSLAWWLVVMVNCATVPHPSISPGSQVVSAVDRDAKNGQLVEVMGTYLEVASGAEPGATPKGLAAIALSDGSLIHLLPPWDPEAVRPAEERRLAGQPVVAKGLLLTDCPPPADGRAHQRVACLLGVSVLSRETYDFLTGTGSVQ